MNQCLYKCSSGAPATQAYHVYPLSASVLNLQLEKGVVCNKCNAYFSKLEKYFIERHPGASHRLHAVRETRKGKEPFFVSQAGKAVRQRTADGYELTYPLQTAGHRNLENGDIVIIGEYAPLPFDSVKIGRLLAKMALESLCPYVGDKDLDPYSEKMDVLRRYARFGPGKTKFLWFAWKRSQSPQKMPQVFKVQDPGKDPVAWLCRISLPGISYLMPFPPITPPDRIRPTLSGWNVVEKPCEIQLAPETVECTLVRIPAEQPLDPEAPRG